MIFAAVPSISCNLFAKKINKGKRENTGVAPLDNVCGLDSNRPLAARTRQA